MDDYFKKIYEDIEKFEKIKNELRDALTLMENFTVVKEYIETKRKYDQISFKINNCISYLPK